MRPRILVSACLVGARCRYDGRDNPCEGLRRLEARAELIPVCPEQLGGLPTPRPPAECRDGGVFTREGADVTAAFCRGAEEACRLARRFGAGCALLKARSPSCGAEAIYDGSFTGRLIPGEGVTARALRAQGVRVFGEDDIEAMLSILEREQHDTI